MAWFTADKSAHNTDTVSGWRNQIIDHVIDLHCPFRPIDQFVQIPARRPRVHRPTLAADNQTRDPISADDSNNRRRRRARVSLSTSVNIASAEPIKWSFFIQRDTNPGPNIVHSPRARSSDECLVFITVGVSFRALSPLDAAAEHAEHARE